VIELTKADVVERQLNTAIWLWFHDQDEVSVQALVSGALKVCHDVGSPAITSDFITLESVPVEQREEVKRLLMESQNFFKHSKKDKESVLKFYPIISEYFLYEAITLTQRVFGRCSVSMFTFGSYFHIHRPHLQYVGPQRINELLVHFELRELAELNREEFFSRLVLHFALPHV
jgi:hypothetical protein